MPGFLTLLRSFSRLHSNQKTLTTTLIQNLRWERCHFFFFLSCLQSQVYTCPRSQMHYFSSLSLKHFFHFSDIQTVWISLSAWLPQNRLLPTLCSLLPGFCSHLHLFLSTLNHNFLFTCLPYSILSSLRIEVMSDLYISPVPDVVLGI